LERFLADLPDYLLGEEERVEVVYSGDGPGSELLRECFPDLEQAKQRALELGPSRDVWVQAVSEPGTKPWETEGTDLLVYWYGRERRAKDGYARPGAVITTMLGLEYSEPSLTFYECFRDGDATLEAGGFYYRSRCPEWRRHQALLARRRGRTA